MTPAPFDMKQISALLSVFMLFCLATQGLSSTATPAHRTGPAFYTVDNVHSSIVFKVKHLDISYLYGMFNECSGDIQWAPGHPDDTSVEFEVMAASVDTGHDGRDDHLRGPDFFAAKEFPTWSFRSTKFEELGDDRYAVVGDITLRGKTEEIRFEMVKTGEGESERWGKKIGFEAKFTLTRTKFGMDYGSPGVGDDVEVTISVEANMTDGHDHSED